MEPNELLAAIVSGYRDMVADIGDAALEMAAIHRQEESEAKAEADAAKTVPALAKFNVRAAYAKGGADALTAFGKALRETSGKR